MDTDQLIDRLFKGRLSESLQVEFKLALDITVPADQVIITRALFALRNFNGGHLFIGVQDTGAVADATACPPAKLRAIDSDAVHILVARYASEPFGCDVRHYPTAVNPQVVAIAVPGGVKSPVVIKKALNNDARSLQEGEIYFRTLKTGGKPSSAAIPWNEWPALFDICFSNREADLARLLRSFGPDVIEKIRTIVCTSPEVPPSAPSAPSTPSAPDATPGPGIGRPQATTSPGSSAPDVPPLAQIVGAEAVSSPMDLTLELFLAEMRAHAEAGFTVRGTDPSTFGSYAVGVISDPPTNVHPPNAEFLDRVMAANPNLTGWPAWLDSRRFSDERYRAFVMNQGWENFLPVPFRDGEVVAEFWRIEPIGRLYNQRGYQDDLLETDPRAPTPRTQLDFALLTYRVAERLEVGRRLCAAMGVPPAGKAHFAFRFDKLRGRELSSWANPGRYISPGQRAEQDEITAWLTLPVSAGQEEIVEATHKVCGQVFNLFGGFSLSSKVTEDLVLRLLQRRM